MRHLPLAALAAIPLIAVPATATAIQPGKWLQQIETTEIDAPGLPPQALQMMPRSFSNSYCLTPEEAARGPQQMLEQSRQQGGQCSYKNFDMAAGKINAVMECKGDGAGAIRMTMRGDYSPTSYRMTMVMEGAGMIRRMTSVSTGRHAGACN